MKGLRVCAWLAAAVLAGCAGGQAEYAGEVTVTSPQLVAVEPGVEVVADANEPLFYSDGYYWLYRDGLWLRSDNYRGGFARIDVNMVPTQLRRLPEPGSYVHFRRSERGREMARRGQFRERTPDQRYRAQAQPYQPQPYGQQQPYGGREATPQPPQAQRPAQPNPMPEAQREDQNQRGDQNLPPQGAEQGTTPQTGATAQPQTPEARTDVPDRVRHDVNQAGNTVEQGAKDTGDKVESEADRAKNQAKRDLDRAKQKKNNRDQDQGQ